MPKKFIETILYCRNVFTLQNGDNLKIDMHCHTAEGSIDARVGIVDYVTELINKGVDGMLVTDHNSYRGYEYWQRIKGELGDIGHFTVLKGIEYDTRNGGHIIIILPDTIKGADVMKARLIGIRGLSVVHLEKIVHSVGGILGPAHPYDTGYYAFMNTRFGKLHPEFLEKFDFIESYNSVAKHSANESAHELALRLDKPQTAGTDTHRPEVIGTSWTEFPCSIRCNDDLIAAIKDPTRAKRPSVPYELFTNMHRDRGRIVEHLGIVGYWLYNRAEVLYHGFGRFRHRKARY